MDSIIEVSFADWTYFGCEAVEALVLPDVGGAFTARLFADSEQLFSWSFTNRRDAEYFARLFVRQ